MNKDKYNLYHRKSHDKYYKCKTYKCLAKNCRTWTSRKYCSIHSKRIKLHRSLDLSIKYYPKGKRNFMWKGGIAEYPNHYLMKKQRLIILINNPKCLYCNKPATQIHHKDENKGNHNLSNLVAVCLKCNLRQSSKFYKKFGYTLDEITKKLNFTGLSRTYWWKNQDKIPYYLLDK